MIEDFVIATVGAPPGRIGICRLPGRSGALEADVAAIRAWDPAIVLSLAEWAEMDELGARGLREMLGSAGIGWRHFPVQDYGAPMPDAEPLWRTLATELHAALDAGQGVIVHCRGGLGRSGMAVARLLAERGEPAPLAKVRASRPGAVETAPQERWAEAGEVRRSPPQASADRPPPAA